jgi:NAD(P)H-hydrate epimerase
VPTNNQLIEAGDAAKLLKKRSKFSHKGSYGHALLIAGSQGKAGAAILSARACHRSGAGLVTLHTPLCSAQAIHAASPETMLSSPEANDYINSLPNNTLYQSIGIGPGIGMHPETATVLKSLIQFSSIPLVLDADAINILGENKTWLAFLPKGSILTPHPKEFERIAGKSSNHYERLELQRAISVKYGVYIVLKGAHTSVTTPSGVCYFNSTGNPGMATAGSGDVLTGIITGLMAQGYPPLESAILGVYLHGLSGDLALEINSFESLIASDLISFLGKAFLKLYDAV